LNPLQLFRFDFFLSLVVLLYEQLTGGDFFFYFGMCPLVFFGISELGSSPVFIRCPIHASPDSVPPPFARSFLMDGQSHVFLFIKHLLLSCVIFLLCSPRSHLRGHSSVIKKTFSPLQYPFFPFYGSFYLVLPTLRGFPFFNFFAPFSQIGFNVYEEFPPLPIVGPDGDMFFRF